MIKPTGTLVSNPQGPQSQTHRDLSLKPTGTPVSNPQEPQSQTHRDPSLKPTGTPVSNPQEPQSQTHRDPSPISFCWVIWFHSICIVITKRPSNGKIVNLT